MFQFVNYRHHSRLGPSFSLANWPSQRHLICRPWVQQSQLAKYKLSVSDFVANLISGAIAKVFTDFLWRLFCWAGQLFWIVFTEMWLYFSSHQNQSTQFFHECISQEKLRPCILSQKDSSDIFIIISLHYDFAKLTFFNISNFPTERFDSPQIHHFIICYNFNKLKIIKIELLANEYIKGILELPEKQSLSWINYLDSRIFSQFWSNGERDLEFLWEFQDEYSTWLFNSLKC